MDPPLSAAATGTAAHTQAPVGGGVADVEGRQSRRHTSPPQRRHTRLLRLLRDLLELPFTLFSLLLRDNDHNAMHGVWELTGEKVMRR